MSQLEWLLFLPLPVMRITARGAARSRRWILSEALVDRRRELEAEALAAVEPRTQWKGRSWPRLRQPTQVATAVAGGTHSSPSALGEPQSKVRTFPNRESPNV